MKVIYVNKENFKSEVLENEGVVLVDFFATWCGPCKMLSPIIDKVAEEVDNIKIVKINVDEEEELARQYNVMSIPTLVVLENGKEKKRSSGFMPKNALLDFIDIK